MSAKLRILTGAWGSNLMLIGSAIANKDTMWLFLSLMAASLLVNVALGGVAWMISSSIDYWVRQPRRVRAGLEVEPGPWYVRLTARSHDSKLRRRILG